MNCTKYKVYGTSEKKLIRMAKSQPKNTKRQVCSELEAAGGQEMVSTVKCVTHQTT